MHEALWRVARSLILQRSYGMCEGCGDRAVDVHHRQPRGMGGVHGVAAVQAAHAAHNLLALCRNCHRLTEDEPDLCRQLGWLVPHPTAPDSVPARLVTPNGTGWWHLLADGCYQWYDREDVRRWADKILYDAG